MFMNEIDRFPGIKSIEGAIHCQWSPFSPWSECEGCNNTQTRWRSVRDYAQFGGRQCLGSKFQFQSCSATRGCPVDEGCGEHFRCASGLCVSQSLRCNGDEDCEGDGADEMNCGDRKMACDIDKIPPQAELTGRGFDVVKGTFRGTVINTKYFGGTCRKVLSGDNREHYRLPESILQYTFQVKVNNDFQSRRYESSWSYLRTTQGRDAATGQGFFSSYSSNYDQFTNRNNQKHKVQTYLTIENEVEVAQFTNSRPEKLQLPSSFHQELLQLPPTYDYGAYRRLIELYGTHYLRQGALGGKYSMLFMVDKDKMNKADFSTTDSASCSQTSFNFIFISYDKSKCEQYKEALRNAMGTSSGQVKGLSSTQGGRPAFVAALSLINVRDPQANSDVYQRWAGSVKEYPVIINQKLGPLHELVKGVPCAGVKRHYLQRAIQQYIDELHPCQCRPCLNNGQPVVVGSTCQCFCKPYTFGLACEKGLLAQDQESGVGVAGGWSCWSGWTTCQNEQRSRSRRCDNPRPSPGGRNCPGQSSQSERCEHREMEYLRPSLPVCVVDGKTDRVMLLTLCKLLALECLGRSFVLVPESTCSSLPPAPAARCGSCPLGETCDEERAGCVCLPEGQCPAGGIRSCVVLEGSEEERTVSECEAAVWRCQRKSFTIVASRPCSQRSTPTTAYHLQG
ncbi:complement component C7-like [Hemiscyllium ocellatum]|uniref:complement component C7-like n=1 Tax=Hemiscyllium ocellatum TaxID=170820 RepID=UPI002966A61B|nr:complement component C7-like [Hemiscyllium ocellatum]